MMMRRIIYGSALLMCSVNMTAQTSTLPGDVDGDRKLTKRDITILSDIISGKTTTVNSTAADFNKDGKVSIKDLTLLIDAILHPTTGECNGHTWVDLGLSVKWATCNVGANSPEEYGSYFAWGETTAKTSFSWSSYLYSIGGKMTTYSDCGTTKDPLRNYVTPTPISIAATPYDAAKANWEGAWRMPTEENQTELRKNCYWEWTDNYKGTRTAGYIVYKAKAERDKGKYSYNNPFLSASYTTSDIHIFLPAAGCYNASKIEGTDIIGRYWSASPTSSTQDAYTLHFDEGIIYRIAYFRGVNGFSIRPVIE